MITLTSCSDQNFEKFGKKMLLKYLTLLNGLFASRSDHARPVTKIDENCP